MDENKKVNTSKTIIMVTIALLDLSLDRFQRGYIGPMNSAMTVTVIASNRKIVNISFILAFLGMTIPEVSESTLSRRPWKSQQ